MRSRSVLVAATIASLAMAVAGRPSARSAQIAAPSRPAAEAAKEARLAWFKERTTDGLIGINPTHVASLRASETSD